MFIAAMALLAGASSLHLFAELPDPRWAWLLPLAVPALRWPRLRPFALFAIGFLWALWRADLGLSANLPLPLEGRSLTVEGRVVSLPEAGPEVGTGTGRQRFLFAVERTEETAWRGLARISWRGGRAAAGERWRLTLRLRRPRGFANPGGFDYAGWLYGEGINATGYVHDRGEARRLAAAPAASLLTLRARLRAAVSDQRLTHAGVLAALTVGERDGIGRAAWRRFTATGTNHLVAISGLHVGLVATLCFFMGRRLWALPGRTVERLPAPQAGALAALVGAVIYAALAGFSLPTQRALVMVAVFMGALLARRPAASGRNLALALMMVLGFDPAAVIAPGFWLSFGAVAAILFGMGGRLRRTPLGSALRVQWLVTLALAPLLLLWFGSVALVSPLANLMAVPWVSVAVVPPALLGALLSPLWEGGGFALLWLADICFDALWRLLGWLAAQPWALWQIPTPPAWLAVCALGGALLLAAPRGVPGRWPGLLLMAPLLLYRPERPAWGEVWVTQLEVGQGLAVVVQSARHTLVFDTGPAFGGDFDTGWAVVAPFLRQRGVVLVDRLVLSHGGNDHDGGARSLLAELPVARVLRGPGRFEVAGEACVAGQEWRWDGVAFRVLNPEAGYSGPDNDGSCVVRVEAAGGSVLLTGDIEGGAEARLVARLGTGLRAELLQVPHHGSATSSTPPFIAAVAPRHALFSVGHRNPFGFPRAAVVERYRAAGAAPWRSDESGAVEFRITARGVGEPLLWRRRLGRFWQ